jgi:hypothetical protein
VGENAPETWAAITLEPTPEETDAHPDDPAPPVTALSNAPNPFRPQTTIRYELLEPSPVTVQIFDYRGRLVRTLLEERDQAAGAKELVWDSRDEGGKRVSSGVYFYRILVGTAAASRKMVVLP